MDIKKISNYLMYIGIMISIYGGYKIYISKKDLPVGACPIENYDYILYTAILFLAASIVIEYIPKVINKVK